MAEPLLLTYIRSAPASDTGPSEDCVYLLLYVFFFLVPGVSCCGPCVVFALECDPSWEESRPVAVPWDSTGQGYVYYARVVF